MAVDPFVKLYSTLLESSLWWGEDAPTRLVWITLLVAADHEGVYQGTLPGLAGKARVSLEEARHALWRLQQPDEDSRTPDNDGRRIQVLEGVGYQLLNYRKYRDKRSPKQVADASYKAAERARQKVRSKPPDSPDMSNESVEASLSLSSLRSGSDPDPDPEHPPCQPPAPAARELMPHERAERRQADATTPGARPALRFEFRPEWKPKTSHRDLGYSLGLNDDDIGARLHDCRNKTFPNGFTSEDKQFNRELAWAARDKETAAFKLAQRKANNVRDFEQPGHRRAGG